MEKVFIFTIYPADDTIGYFDIKTNFKQGKLLKKILEKGISDGLIYMYFIK